MEFEKKEETISSRVQINANYIVWGVNVCAKTQYVTNLDVSNRFVSDNNNLIALELVWIGCDIIHTHTQAEVERREKRADNHHPGDWMLIEW